MRVAAVLPHQVGRPPEVADRVTRPPERAEAGDDRPPLAGGCVCGPAQELRRAAQPFGRVAQDARERRGGAVLAGLEDRGRVGLGPSVGDGRDHDVGVEDGEGGGHDLSRHLPHARAAAAEVPRQVGEAELAVGAMGLGREVDVGRKWLDQVAQPAAHTTYTISGGHTGTLRALAPARLHGRPPISGRALL